jgi:hypothetical protein
MKSHRDAGKTNDVVSSMTELKSDCGLTKVALFLLWELSEFGAVEILPTRVTKSQLRV